MVPDLVLFDGAAIKTAENRNGTVTLTGLAVVFDAPDSGKEDLTGEHFTASTYYGPAAESGRITVDAPFNHHIPINDSPEAEALADALLGVAMMDRTDKGWMASLVLSMRTREEDDIAQLAADGKLGWSTGTAGHMYRKTKSGQITRWPIVEVSPTPTPAEPRTFATVKSVRDLMRPSRSAHADFLAALRAFNT